jgi:hypothetical protein
MRDIALAGYADAASTDGKAQAVALFRQRLDACLLQVVTVTTCNAVSVTPLQALQRRFTRPERSAGPEGRPASGLQTGAYEVRTSSAAVNHRDLEFVAFEDNQFSSQLFDLAANFPSRPSPRTAARSSRTAARSSVFRMICGSRLPTVPGP